MRILHPHKSLDTVNIGVYACSPLDAGLPAHITGFSLDECQWELLVNPEGLTKGEITRHVV
jgi:regulation of enolase protein 1 (concanavalin A-like superfamily)